MQAWLISRSAARRIDTADFDVNGEAVADLTPTNTGDADMRAGTSADLSSTTDETITGEKQGVAVVDFLAGESLTYTARVEVSGYHTLRVRHQGPASSIRISTSNQARPFDLELSASDSWTTSEMRVLLKKGAQELKLSATGSANSSANSSAISLLWFELQKEPFTAAVLAKIGTKGSYAQEPPTEALELSQDLFKRVYETTYQWIDRPEGSPLPTNDWWSNILEPRSPFTGSVWPFPMRMTNDPRGVTVTAYSRLSDKPGNIAHEGAQSIMVQSAGNETFKRNALVRNGDWTLTYRMEQAEEKLADETSGGAKFMDVTIGRGIPMTWFEFTGMSPVLELGDGAKVFDADGAAVTESVVAKSVRIEKDVLHFAVFAPAGTTFRKVNNRLEITFAAAERFVVVAQLPDVKAFDLFANHAYTMPTDSRFDFSYDQAAGTVTTTWKLTTRALESGASSSLIQGWLPHNYRGVVKSPELLGDYAYISTNGPIKLSVGSEFTIVQPAPNVSMNWPTPRQIGGVADYDPERMKYYLSKFAAGSAAKPEYGDETYFGMKPIQVYAQNVLIARQMNDPSYEVFLNALRVSMTNWLTYTPGEGGCYFTYYPKDKALIGFNPSFGSENFTDNHFHYGYHTAAAGVLAMLDPEWANQYGEMATMIAKQYANWDRTDTRFPYLRTFEPWIGYSYAGGMGDARGNNQESVSEAIQSWLGLILLGQALGDMKMTETGMMGYSIESKAALEYWFDANRDLFPKTYDRANVAINYDDSKGSYTFFGADPEYVLGIIALPVWPALDYMGKAPETMKFAVERMLKQRVEYLKTDAMRKDLKNDSWSSFDNGRGPNSWLNVNMGIQTYYDPQGVAVEYDRMWNDKTETGLWEQTGMYYWQAHAYRSNGQRDWTRRLSVPIGAAYFEPKSGRRVYVAYNPSGATRLVKVMDESGKVVTEFDAPPGQITMYEPEVKGGVGGGNTGEIGQPAK